MRTAQRHRTLEEKSVRCEVPGAVARLLLCAGLAVVFPAVARADTATPALVAFSFSPVSIDTSAGAAGVAVTLRVTDDSSGIALVRVVFSHRDVLSDPLGCETSAPQSGTGLDGVFVCTVDFPQFSEPGTWKAFVVDMLDAAGNQDLVTTTELAGLGFPTDLEVVSRPDTTPPVLAGFNFLPRAIDTSTAAAEVNVSFHATDDRSGVAWAKVTFVEPVATGTIRGCTSLAVTPGQDPALDVVLACDVGFPQFSAEGAWKVYGVELQDVAGNSSQYPTASLAALGLPTDLNITSVPDTAPPTLIDFTFSPAAIDTEGGDTAVQVTFVAGDDLSGVASVEAVFAAPGASPLTRDCVSAIPGSGSSLTGTFTCPVQFPRHSPEGTWRVSQVNARDAVNNSVSYSTSDLVLAGFPADLGVGFLPGAPRAVIAAPGAGRSIRGDSVTVAARLLQGGPGGVSRSAGVRLEYRALPSGSFTPIPARDAAQPNPDTSYPYLIHWDVSGVPQGDYELRAVAHDSGGVPDPAPAAITITLAAAGDIDEHVDAQGRQESRTAVDGATDGDAAAGDRTPQGALARVTLPAGSLALSADVVRAVYPDAAGEAARLEQPGQSAGVFVEVLLESGQGALAQGLAAAIDVHYADADQDGVVDQTGIREEDLELRRLDEAGNAYLGLPPWIVLTEHNVVHGVATQLGRFALTGPLEPRLRFEPDAVTLAWDPVSEALSYNVYRGGLAQMRDADGDGLPDGGYGECQNGRDPDPADTVFIDGDVPAGPAGGFFYLVTFVGPYGEKGLGTTSAGLRRTVAASCP